MARPVGSTIGRQPAGGYPSLDRHLGGFLAGFIEGEASFTVPRQPQGTNHRCMMAVTVRDDDAALLALFADKTKIGRLTRRGAYRTSKPQTVWTVGAKSDCVRLTEILDDFPLRGRKSYDYAIWRAALRSWVGDGVTVYKKNRDWEAMRYLKARLQDGRVFDPNRAPYRIVDFQSAVNDWSDYVSGLLSADGCLAIVRNGKSLSPRVQITLRADDLPLLEAVRGRVGTGRIYIDQVRRGNSAPAAAWTVRDRAGLEIVRDYLAASPPRGRRGLEYDVWSDAVSVYRSNGSTSLKRRELAELRSALAAIRAYPTVASAN